MKFEKKKKRSPCFVWPSIFGGDECLKALCLSLPPSLSLLSSSLPFPLPSSDFLNQGAELCLSTPATIQHTLNQAVRYGIAFPGIKHALGNMIILTCKIGNSCIDSTGNVLNEDQKSRGASCGRILLKVILFSYSMLLYML